MTTPQTSQAPPPELANLGLALVDTEQGQRLALTLTIHFQPATAKDIARALTQISGAMSQSRLVVANGIVQP